MTILMCIICLLYFRKEVKGLASSVKLLLLSSTCDLVDDAKESLRSLAVKKGMKDAQKATIEEVVAFVSNN